MKLLIAIVNNEDSAVVSSALTKEGFSVTKLSTTGGFLMVGNTTFLIGAEDDKVTKAKEIIKEFEPQAIIFYCDRMLGYEQVFLSVAKNIPTIVIPIAFLPSEGKLKERYYNLSLEVLENKKDINVEENK